MPQNVQPAKPRAIRRKFVSNLGPPDRIRWTVEDQLAASRRGIFLNIGSEDKPHPSHKIDRRYRVTLVREEDYVRVALNEFRGLPFYVKLAGLLRQQAEFGWAGCVERHAWHLTHHCILLKKLKRHEMKKRLVELGTPRLDNKLNLTLNPNMRRKKPKTVVT